MVKYIANMVVFLILIGGSISYYYYSIKEFGERLSLTQTILDHEIDARTKLNDEGFEHHNFYSPQENEVREI